MALNVQEGALFLPRSCFYVLVALILGNVANEKHTHHVRLSAHIVLHENLNANRSLGFHEKNETYTALPFINNEILRFYFATL
jgi:hypothetical protein